MIKFTIPLYLFLQLGLFATLNAQAETDPKARALAESVLQQMGGAEGWAATRFISWGFNGQYQIWDKQKQQYRWEKENVVVVLSLKDKTGKIYLQGEALQDEEKEQKLLEHVYAQWLNNSFWLLMPFHLLEPDTELKYSGEGKTQTGAAAELLEVSFPKDGKGKYLVWVDKAERLIKQWAFFKDDSDTIPVFIRKWSDYSDYGAIKLAADRSSLQSDLRLHRIAVPAHVPDAVFYSPVPVMKSGLAGY